MKLGILHVERDIMNGLTAKEFLGWEAFARLEPFDFKWENYKSAMIVREIRNLFLEKGATPATLDDCSLAVKEEPDTPRAPQTFQEQIAIAKIMSMAAATRPRDI